MQYPLICPLSPARFLFVHVPKASNYYKPLDEFTTINYVPMGVFGLCDLLNRQGMPSSILHLGLRRIEDPLFSIGSHVQETGATWVGLSLHWHHQSYDVLDVARSIRAANPGVRIVVGGLTSSRFPREILEECPAVDYVIRGDAELGLTSLVAAVEAGDTDLGSVPNLVWREADTIRDNGIGFVADDKALEGLDFACFEHFDQAERYRDWIKPPFTWSVNAPLRRNLTRRVGGARTVFPLMVGRGCPVQCSFCGGSRSAQASLCGRGAPYFRRSVTQVVDTMEKAIGFGYEAFLVCFDPTPANDSWWLELCAEVRRRGLRCGLGFEAWGLPTKRLVEELARTFQSKLSYLALSPECGSESVRRRNKGFFYTNDQMREALGWIEAAGMPSLVYLTHGLPGETQADLDATTRLAKELGKRFRKSLAGILLLPVQLEPGSPMFEDPQAHGIRTHRRSFRDFVQDHGRAGEELYAELGYVSDSLELGDGDPAAFRDHLAERRCREHCIMAPRLLGHRMPSSVGRLLCRMVHKGWLRAGHGKPCTSRARFVEGAL